jgi:hypothetical protein
MIVSTMAAASAALPSHADDRVALLVGVERYDESELAPLDWAEDDVEAIGRALEGLGFSVVTMTSASTVAARRPVLPSDILTQLDKRLADRQKSDTVVVAFSGHGVQFKDDEADSSGAKELWFCPERAQPGDRTTLLPITEVLRRIDACKAGRKLLLVDACRNDFVPPNGSKSGRVIELPAAGVKRPPIPAGMVALFSCRPGEQSFELKALGHSIFSQHVIDFLEGKAPADRYPRGAVQIRELTSYVSSKTRDTAEVNLDRVQVPDVVLPTGSFGDWPLGIIEKDRPTGSAPAVAKSPFSPDQARELQRSWARHLGVKEEFTNDLGITFRLIPPGEFAMGGDPYERVLRERRRLAQRVIERDGVLVQLPWSEEDAKAATEEATKARQSANTLPVHDVRITKPWFCATRTVSATQFRAIMGRDPGKGEDSFDEDFLVSWYDATEFCNRLSEREGRPLVYEIYDVVRESDKESQMYGAIKTATVTRIPRPHAAAAGRGGYRLLTEAEWEFVARGGRAGDEPEAILLDDAIDRLGLTFSGGETHEWVFDLYGTYTAGKQVDPTGASVEKPSESDAVWYIPRVLRGWQSNATDRDRCFCLVCDLRVVFRIACD